MHVFLVSDQERAGQMSQTAKMYKILEWESGESILPILQIPLTPPWETSVIHHLVGMTYLKVVITDES